MVDKNRWHNIAASWWQALQPDEKRRDPVARVGDRASLARLRRCTNLAQAVTVKAALDLAHELKLTPETYDRFESVLLTAIVLAHVRTDDRGAPVARQLGGDTRAPMSPLRFARLLNAETAEEKLIAFRRAVALLGGKTNVLDLARALLDWSEKTRVVWAFEYYGAPPPAAAANTAQPAAGDAA